MDVLLSKAGLPTKMSCNVYWFLTGLQLDFAEQVNCVLTKLEGGEGLPLAPPKYMPHARIEVQTSEGFFSFV